MCVGEKCATFTGVFTKSHPRLNGESIDSRAQEKEALPGAAVCALLRQGSPNFLAMDRSQYEASIGEAEVARVEISCQGLEGTVGLCLLRAAGDLKVLKTETGEGGRGKGEQIALYSSRISLASVRSELKRITQKNQNKGPQVPRREAEVVGSRK